MTSGKHECVTGEKSLDLDDIRLLLEDVQEAQSVLDKLTSIVPFFGMRFALQSVKLCSWMLILTHL